MIYSKRIFSLTEKKKSKDAYEKENSLRPVDGGFLIKSFSLYPMKEGGPTPCSLRPWAAWVGFVVT